ncbi:MAG: hypothetical protein A4E52_00122 [Pelotomaculum sp. PtaB.Bin013]|uniref:Uncharacterized protein n=1 Tax=Pelotomaculum isophthalicicum JI TaxID=947010 RepID=A0A9X4H1N9_9FIRM|nr:hypothetical protein [Pelotomaculum isophthalicicum]MDF9408235.1 hypothetical protein [Pelotomaculum isophthalicicum JI]OPX92120.1 MAG: hypothetical protein A4E52_00122 [Pelotomaculum sp. PtaB.Bin013]
MKLIDFLDRVGEERVWEIALALQVVGVGDNFYLGHIKKLIIDFLTHSRSIDWLLNRLGPRSVSTLKKMVYSWKSPGPGVESTLSRYGLVFHGQIPDDLRELYVAHFYPKVVGTFPGVPRPVVTSAFLKLVLLLGFIQREKVVMNPDKPRSFSQKMKKLSGQLGLCDDHWLREILEYLKDRRLIYIKNGVIFPDRGKLLSWYSDMGHDCKWDFYEWVAAKTRSEETLEFLTILARAQRQQEDWINVEVFSGLVRVREISERLGLVRYMDNGEKCYVQLTAEGWHISKKSYPDEWIERAIVVSADFETCIPCTYDPQIIAIMDYFGELVTHDFFLVFTLENLKGKTRDAWCDYREFLKVLSERSRRLPDVVRYKLKQDFH